MDRIGRYRIVGEVGRGTIGVVYRANDPATGRDVAIKPVRLDAADESREKLRERLFREPRSASVLSHNIATDEDGAVKITDFGIARLAAAERLSDTRTITGTPNYMSPEQRGLAKDPAKCFASCTSFVGALGMACAESPGWTPMHAGVGATLPTVGTEWPHSERAPVDRLRAERHQIRLRTFVVRGQLCNTTGTEARANG